MKNKRTTKGVGDCQREWRCFSGWKNAARTTSVAWLNLPQSSSVSCDIVILLGPSRPLWSKGFLHDFTIEPPTVKLLVYWTLNRGSIRTAQLCCFWCWGHWWFGQVCWLWGWPVGSGSTRPKSFCRSRWRRTISVRCLERIIIPKFASLGDSSWYRFWMVFWMISVGFFPKGGIPPVDIGMAPGAVAFPFCQELLH